MLLLTPCFLGFFFKKQRLNSIPSESSFSADHGHLHLFLSLSLIPSVFRKSHPIPFFGATGFFSAPHGDYWKFMKKILISKLLGPQAIERSRVVRGKELERFYFDLLDKARKKDCVEIRKEAMKFTNNSTCQMILGRRCWEENGEAERVWGLITQSISSTKKVLFTTLLRKPLEKLGITLFKEEIMGISGRYDKQKKTKTQSTDTSKQTIQWTMAEIINSPDTIERMREEIDSVVGKSRLIQETDLPNLPYLQAVVKEGLRLYPPVPIFGRRLQEGCVMGGFYVSEKTTLVVNGYAVMRDPEYWEYPDDFKPERFLASSRPKQEDATKEQVLNYLPFGSGRRGCPGSNLAYIFLGTAIGMMIQCFDWKIEEDKVNMEETLSGMRICRTVA
uniref:Cytochrome P450 705A21 n=1 Tax=Isatis tinctoria TaxID=161756 RepID=A0A8F0FS97_ISATI|nr:cytochrome P450 705A21 [Isatis tinctoria]